MKTKAAEVPTRVIKRGTCPTVSGKSSITYQLGSDADDRLVLRIHSNDGGGFFSMEWIPIADILSALESWPSDSAITSVALSEHVSVLTRGIEGRGCACADREETTVPPARKY
jgi:hypothetical protein